MTANEVRIIGGNWRGRKLKFQNARGLRPTLGRVRGTLFNWLNSGIRGSRCLDLFAGSGALGFEALSRGAAEVVFVEENRRSAQALRDNAATLGAGSTCRIVCQQAARFLREPHPTWDIVFLDPPFGTTLLADTLQMLLVQRALHADSHVYFETSRRDSTAFKGYSVLREGTAGETRFGLLEPEPGTPERALEGTR